MRIISYILIRIQCPENKEELVKCQVFLVLCVEVVTHIREVNWIRLRRNYL
jgi:hypothetical protein